jgi:phosphoserine/homoserine phosphotransferase
VAPLLARLGRPTIFCNRLVVDADNMLAGYFLRQPDGKRHATVALRGLGFRLLAAGDSYNDTTMLAAADAGILFRPPANVVAEFSHFPVVYEYDELRARVERFLAH